jgi:hypothetical protein
LSEKYGDNYIDHEENGNYLINSAIRKKIHSMKNAEPQRYARLIDASLLEHQIDIICNPALYSVFFAGPLKIAFPEGNAEARTFLSRLVYPRNCLYHANPLSVRMSEQVVCYSHDIIESIKVFYMQKNNEREYNVPQVVKITDSFGNVFHLNGSGSRGINLHKRTDCYLYPGETLSIEIEV